jgi:acylphosphatase
MPDVTAVRAVVTGRVQGVGYRYATREQAGQLGISGWVRNLPSGQVEVLAQGPGPAVDALIAWLERGPRWASVSRVTAVPVEPNPDLETFHVQF